ncbi:predicted protein [Botrytis cinerea T4]|uniref:Uncharacterized protein n=1 Tax=Botryotinia fuckeliana (strain T4) TaxID=999810 RepID=G2Y930_BOTF4|nr:predicted protein [Botrytis cinerea T4]
MEKFMQKINRATSRIKIVETKPTTVLCILDQDAFLAE